MKALIFCGCLAVAAAASAQTVDRLVAHKVKLESVDYLGKRAVKMTEEGEVANGEAYAIVKDAVFHNGAIERGAGRPSRRAAPPPARAASSASRSACRTASSSTSICGPTNGRADDQVRRNHSTQYSAHPNFGFAGRGKEAPEKYESYVDLEPGVWTRYRITVEGTKPPCTSTGADSPA